MTDTSLAGLRSAIERAGYYPELVADAVDAAVAGEDVEAFVVHQETTFDSEEVRRHITVLVLTPGRLVLGHADDHPADEVTPAPFVTAATEAVPLSSVRSVVVNRVVTDPMRYRRRRPAAGGHRHDRLGRGQPPRPRAGRLLRPRLRRRPRLHRHRVRRRHRAAGQRGGRGRRRRRPGARLRRGAVPRHRAVTGSARRAARPRRTAAGSLADVLPAALHRAGRRPAGAPASALAAGARGSSCCWSTGSACHALRAHAAEAPVPHRRCSATPREPLDHAPSSPAPRRSRSPRSAPG